MHTKISDLGHWFSNCALWHTLGASMSSGPGRDQEEVGWGAGLASAEQPASDLFGRLNPTPPASQISHGHKGWRIPVLDQPSHFLHAQLTTSRWHKGISPRSHQSPLNTVEDSEIYQVWESRKIFIGSVAGLTSQLQKQKQRQTLSPSGRQHDVQGCALEKPCVTSIILCYLVFNRGETPRDSKCQGYTAGEELMSKPRSLDPKAQALDYVIHIMSTNRQPLCVPYALAQPMSYMDTHPLKKGAIHPHGSMGYKQWASVPMPELKSWKLQIQLLYLCGNES